MDNFNQRTPGIFYREGCYVIDTVKTVRGKRIHIYQRGFSTLEEAQNTFPHLLEERLSAHNLGAHSPTFEEFIVEFKAYRGHHVRPSTVMQIDSMARMHMGEFSGKRLGEAFAPLNVKNWYRGLIEDHSVSNQWKNKIISASKKMFEMAWKWKYIPPEDYTEIANTLESVIESKRRGKEKQIWTPRQLDRFLSVLPPDSSDEAMFRLFCALGARISEFTGLTWDCFDEKKGTIEIKQQVLYHGVSTFVLTGELKTRESYRSCKLDPTTYGILMEYKQRQNPIDSSEFVFPSTPKDKHRPTAKSTLRRKMETYMDKARVPHITPHGVRHTKATMLMAVCKNMAEVKAAARYLGHSATMMIDTYGHAKEDATSAILARLEKR